MSRSSKKNLWLSYVCCNSEKRDKQSWHRAFRRKERQNLGAHNTYDDYMTLHYRDVSNPWEMGKDGKYLCKLEQIPYQWKRK